MGRYRVDGIRERASHTDPHETVRELTGQNPYYWYDTEASVIRFIENGDHTYYTLVSGREAEVVVGSHNGRKQLKTTVGWLGSKPSLETSDVAAHGDG